MNWTLVGIFGTILAFAGYVWYSIRKQALSEEEAASKTEAYKAEAEKRHILEQKAAESEAKVREQETKNAKEITDSHNVDAARRLLGDAFRK